MTEKKAEMIDENETPKDRIGVAISFTIPLFVLPALIQRIFNRIYGIYGNFYRKGKGRLYILIFFFASRNSFLWVMLK